MSPLYIRSSTVGVSYCLNLYDLSVGTIYVQTAKVGKYANDAEALAQMLVSPEGVQAIEHLLDAVGGWHGLYQVGPQRLIAVLGEDRRRQVEALFKVVASWLEIRPLSKVIDGPSTLWQLLRPRLAFEPVEGFWVVSLDIRARVIGFERVAQGILNACLIHAREVFAPALQVRAASIVLIHNHPSGDPEPSAEDQVLTDRLISAGALLGIPVVDHIVVARGGATSILGI
ncbi:MAG: JAB domain-containing protein [Myxococcales bacterium]|nr:JAB domain-containing protein [Myxococcales bacterium]